MGESRGDQIGPEDKAVAARPFFVWNGRAVAGIVPVACACPTREIHRLAFPLQHIRCELLVLSSQGGWRYISRKRSPYPGPHQERDCLRTGGITRIRADEAIEP